MPLTVSFSVPVSTRTTFRVVFRIIALAVMAVLINSYSVYPQTEVSTAERALFEALNRERAAKGLPALHWDAALAAAAREHASRMAQRNVLSHQLPGEPQVQVRASQAGARFTTIAENIAVAPNSATIHSAWMRSPHHRENILDPELNGVGIGVVRGSDGLFAVQDFSQVVANLNFKQQEQQVIANLNIHGMQATRATNEARKTCEMDRGYAGTRPLSVTRFETADLSKLPFDLERKIRSGRYHSASVGACEGGSSAGFTHFKLVVELF
ncbi:MAG TPA: CAP domain-containing protein [Methylomirabilota bacterium]|jgi:uncharacterized protein YkwD|nr:CAP domain-containing protein [Methylomirabilota bacterium]